MDRAHAPRAQLTSIYRPRVTSGRLLAGILSGMTAGVILGFPFAAILMEDAQGIAGPLGLGLFWLLHMIVSTSIGIAFSIFVAPRAYGTSIMTSLVVVLVGVYGGGRILLAYLGTPFVLDTRQALEIAGHILFAFILGAGYVLIHRTEIKDAALARNERWHAWARKELRAT